MCSYVNAQPGIAPIATPIIGFGIDGDANANTPSTYLNSGDWFSDGTPGSGTSLFDMTDITYPYTFAYPLYSLHYKDSYGGVDISAFTSSTKVHDPYGPTFTWGATQVPNKNEINNAVVHFDFGASPGDPNDLWCIFSADRMVNNGDAYIDFEFLQHPVEVIQTGVDANGRAKGYFDSDGPDGTRTVGDLIVTIKFTQGGTTATPVIHKWVETPVGSGLFDYVEQDLSAYTGAIFMMSNNVIVTPLWSPFGQPSYDLNQFAEGAINLSALMPSMQSSCGVLSTVFVRTKTSQSPTAELKDYAGDPYQVNICIDDELPVLIGVPTGGDLGCNPTLPACANVTATDNCTDPITVECTPGTIQEDGCNMSQTFSYEATDDCGNVASADVTYTWKEEIAVDAICPAPVNITDPCTALADIQTAYNNWKAGFSYSNGCGVTTNIGSIPALPANVDCSGANLTFTYSVTANCSSDWCVSSFDVAPDVAVDAVCPSTVNITDPCTSLASIQTTYNNWKAGFSHTVSCSVTDNSASIPTLPANVDCSGANLTFTYSVTAHCSSDWCVSSFNVAADVAVDAICPTPIDITDPCTALASIEDQYDAWVDGFHYTGGCGVTTNIASIPSLPSNVDCDGTNLTFTYSVTGHCSSDWCVSSFNVAADVAVDAICPTPVDITDPCTALASIEDQYDAWVDGFHYTGGCGVTTNIASIPALPADVDCSGANLTFTYSVTAHCSSDDCISTFKVAADVPVVATCAAPVNITDPCTALADIQTAYNTWKAGFSYSNGCGVTTNIGSIPALPTDVDCNGANLTFTYSVTAHCSSDDCISTFKVAADVPIEATCPTDVSLSACTSTTDITLAYNAWKAGFSYTGGCSASTNIGDIPALPSDPVCDGANLTFTYSVTSHCSTDWCISKFVVVADDEDPIFTSCPTDQIDLGMNPTELPDEAMAILYAGEATDDCDVTYSAVGDPTTGECITTQLWTVTATDYCGNTATCDVTFTWEMPCEMFCSLTQGFYGTPGGTYCGIPTESLLATLLETSLTVGISVGSYTIPASDGPDFCIFDILPGGGPSKVLNKDFVCPDLNSQSGLKNSLVAQTIALGLNLRLKEPDDPDYLGNMVLETRTFVTMDGTSCDEATADPVPGTEQSYSIPVAVWNALPGTKTVDDLYVLANNAITGNTSGINLGEIASALNAINAGLDNCRFIYFTDPPVTSPSPNNPNITITESPVTMTIAPNPFQNQVEIKYMVEDDTKVILEVYNLQGVKVATIFDGNATAGFEYTYMFAPPKHRSEQVFLVVLRSMYGVTTKQIISTH